jgi:hypothetical protein
VELLALVALACNAHTHELTDHRRRTRQEEIRMNAVKGLLSLLMTSAMSACKDQLHGRG